MSKPKLVGRAGHLLRQIWEGISHADTASSLLGWITGAKFLLGGAGGVGGGLVTALTGLHPAIISLGVLVGIAGGLLIVNEVASRRLLHRFAAEGGAELPIPAAGGMKNTAGATIVPSRKDLPSITDSLSGCSSVWALWHTATQADNENVWALRKIHRMILLHPDGASIANVAPVFGRTIDDIAQDISGATERARTAGVEVRWFDGPIHQDLTLFDPMTNHGHVRVELLLPFAGTQERPTLDTRYSARLPAIR